MNQAIITIKNPPGLQEGFDFLFLKQIIQALPLQMKQLRHYPFSF